MERVVKGFTGYSKEKEGKPATHIILTVEEHKRLLSQIELAKIETQDTKDYADSEIRKCKKEADELIEQGQEQAQNHVKAIQNDLDEAKREIDRLNDLNANLLRISRERANAKRGLKPKKVHHGYMVLDSQQYKFNIRKYNARSRKTEVHELPCWKVRIQTPYDCSMQFAIITKNIYEDFEQIFGNSLGIKNILPDNSLDNKPISEISELWKGTENFVFKTSYKSNYKSGLWEVEYLVRGSIIVPEDMRVVL